MHVNPSLRPRSFSVVVVLLAFVLPLAIGCGGGKGKVTGNVTLDGKPLPGGTIVFHPTKGTPVSAEITDGQYTITNAPTGTLAVTVDTAYLKQEAEALGMANRNMAMSMGRGAPGGNMPPEAKAALDKEKKRADESLQKSKELTARYRQIPDKYTKTESSGLSVQVKAGSNPPFDVTLSSR